MPMPPSNKTFYVLDFDRCLANTDKLFALFEYAVLQEGALGKEVLDDARAAMERTKGSFDVLAHLKEYLASSGQQDMLLLIKDTFLKASQDYDFFEPGARDLLQFLRDSSLPFGILTYGGRVWQQMKLQATGLEATPHIITDIQTKGKIIAEWKQPSGTFLVPAELGGGEFENVVLVDDKFVSFEGLPERAFGIHVLTKNAAYSSDTLPVHLTQVNNMTEVETLIKSSISA
jgi:FMN phosphatase YigB (HAD superfamily)